MTQIKIIKYISNNNSNYHLLFNNTDIIYTYSKNKINTKNKPYKSLIRSFKYL